MSWLIWLFLGIVVVLVLVMYFGRTTGANGFPGVVQFPFFGAAFTVDRDDVQAYSMRLVEEHKFATICLTVLDRVAYVTSDVRDAELVLSDVEQFVKGDRFQMNLNPLLGQGIFNADGALWASQRKAASHMFAASRLREFQQEIFVRDAQTLADLLLQKQGEVVDLQNLFYSLTFDSFCTLAFGEAFHTLQQTADAADNRKPDFLHAFDVVVATLTRRFATPPLFWKTQALLGIGPEAALARHMELIDGIVFGIVDKVLQLPADELESRRDLLALYAQYARKTGDNSLLDRKFLRDVVTNFILAGRDTTASTLSSLMRVLGHHRTDRDRLEVEIDAVRGQLSFEALKDLPFTEACLFETLRMFPPVLSDSKVYVGEKPVKLPSGPLLVTGDIVAYKIGGVQRNPAYWSEPNDFRPRRWIDKDASKDVIFSKPVEQHQYYFLAFHAGRRICLGKQMALVEAKTCVASLVRAGLRFELVDRDDDLRNWSAFTPAAVIALKRGLKVRVSKRALP
jgi:cytochrome P450